MHFVVMVRHFEMSSNIASLCCRNSKMSHLNSIWEPSSVSLSSSCSRLNRALWACNLCKFSIPNWSPSALFRSIIALSFPRRALNSSACCARINTVALLDNLWKRWLLVIERSPLYFVFLLVLLIRLIYWSTEGCDREDRLYDGGIQPRSVMSPVTRRKY